MVFMTRALVRVTLKVTQVNSAAHCLDPEPSAWPIRQRVEGPAYYWRGHQRCCCPNLSSLLNSPHSGALHSVGLANPASGAHWGILSSKSGVKGVGRWRVGETDCEPVLDRAGNLCHYNPESGSYYFMPDGHCYSWSTEGNSCLPRVVMRAFVGREQENMMHMRECVHPCGGPAGGR